MSGTSNKGCAVCGSTLPPSWGGPCPRCLLEEPIPPAKIRGNIEIGEEIGRGGMGVVYRSKHLGLHREVAVKFLPTDLSQLPEFRARFEREARALALLDHPHIVRIQDAGEEDGQAFLVMEFAEGGSLASRLPLGPEKTFAVVLQVLDALAFAHGKGIVHRDLKPENILFDATGRVKVGDFGIAKLMDDGATPTLTRSNANLGTPGFMAPEAWAGGAADARTDLYAVGVLLYQGITGKLPQGPFEKLPAGIEAFLRKALAANPAERFGSAQEMAQALRDIRLAEPTSAVGCDDFPTEERNWMRQVAILQAIATALALWALLQCITPKVIPAGEKQPLIMLATETLSDGRVLSRARFETGPILAAFGSFVLAIGAYTLLRMHWKRQGLLQPSPKQPLRESKWVLAFGALSLAVYALRHLLEQLGQDWARTYTPILGGVMELLLLYFFWMAALQSIRRSRSLIHEWKLWLGLGLGLIPPCLELFHFLTHFTP